MNISEIRELGLPFSSGSNLFNPKVSYHVGAFVKIPSSEKVYLQGEVIYSRKGSRLRDQTGNRLNFRLNYLTIPVLVGIQLNDWSLLFGTEVGIKVGDQRANSLIDFGLAGGCSYYFSENLQLGLRIIQGLSALNNLGFNDGGGVTGLNQLRNQTWQLSLTYDLIKI